MSKVKLHIQDFDVIDKNRDKYFAFTESWDLPRKMVYEYESPLQLNGEVAAEQAYHLTNAPKEYLTEEEIDLIIGYKGHSLSVGDVVEVDGVKYLCVSAGWEKQPDAA